MIDRSLDQLSCEKTIEETGITNGKMHGGKGIYFQIENSLITYHATIFPCTSASLA